MKKLLICDLDNTLYDWVSYFVPAFYALIDEVVRTTGCDREKLLDDFREVHRRHHDFEHPFALLETATIRDLFPNANITEIATQLDRAFHAFNSTRKRSLALYPSVHETLERIRAAGVVLVAHTESKLFAVVDRLTCLGLTPFFTRIYCMERPLSLHPHPDAALRWLDGFPIDRVVELSHHQRKPNPDVLLEICQRERIEREEAAYVGDSLAKDVLMAKAAGVFAIWAKYGADVDGQLYKKLVRVSHWTPEDVAREAELKERAQGVQPDFILENSFDEVMKAVGIGAGSTQSEKIGVQA